MMRLWSAQEAQVYEQPLDLPKPDLILPVYRSSSLLEVTQSLRKVASTPLLASE
jgi:hypothetical protein